MEAEEKRGIWFSLSLSLERHPSEPHRTVKRARVKRGGRRVDGSRGGSHGRRGREHLAPFLLALARRPALGNAVFEHLFVGKNRQHRNPLRSKYRGAELITYLGTNNVPLALLVILARGPQGVHVLLLPNAEALAQALVLHLQGGDVPDFVLVVFEARRDVFPRQGFGFF